MSFTLTVVLVVIVSIVSADHFRGGTISWRPEKGKKVKFQFRLGYELGRGPGCGVGQEGNFTSQLSSDEWICSKGCAANQSISNVNYYCAAAHLIQNWEQGENQFNYDFPTVGDFTISYTGLTWIPLDYTQKGTTGNFYLQTTGDLRTRSDIGIPNSSPMTASLPVYEVPFGCKTTVDIPLVDVDNDVVACRWAAGVECGGINNCYGLPHSTLSKMDCKLTMEPTVANGYKSDGWYVVTLVVEDFPQKSLFLDGMLVGRNHTFSSVPLQFVVHTVPTTSACLTIPVFTTPTPPNNHIILVPGNASLALKIYARHSSSSQRISEIVISPPYGLTVTSPIKDDLGRQRVWYSTLSWQPDASQKGHHILCLQALDNLRMPSEQRCYVLIVGDPHPCSSSPCQNNGSCSLGLDTFICQCQTGFTGLMCENDIDECQGNPCQNGGTCWNQIGGYQCLCPIGFLGKHCQDHDNCGSSPCLNLGTCLSTPAGYNCSCVTGYNGTECQTEIDECESSPCENNGVCQDMVGDYFCRCPMKYTGKRCEHEIDYCDPNPCKNGGHCTLYKDSYSCSCPSSYLGLNCEFRQQSSCSNPEDSYCMCKVDGRTVKIPFPEPVIQGLDKSDLVAGVVGYPIGASIGAICVALWHFYLRRKCLNKDDNISEGRSRHPTARPSSSSSTTSLLDRSSPTSPGPAVVNVYRSGFHDDTIHKTGHRLSDESYVDGNPDW